MSRSSSWRPAALVCLPASLMAKDCQAHVKATVPMPRSCSVLSFCHMMKSSKKDVMKHECLYLGSPAFRHFNTFLFFPYYSSSSILLQYTLAKPDTQNHFITMAFHTTVIMNPACFCDRLWIITAGLWGISRLTGSTRVEPDMGPWLCSIPPSLPNCGDNVTGCPKSRSIPSIRCETANHKQK